jgi:hypothetical protein
VAPQARFDRRIGHAVGQHQDHLRPFGVRRANRPARRAALKFPSLIVSQRERPAAPVLNQPL